MSFELQAHDFICVIDKSVVFVLIMSDAHK